MSATPDNPDGGRMTTCPCCEYNIASCVGPLCPECGQDYWKEFARRGNPKRVVWILVVYAVGAVSWGLVASVMVAFRQTYFPNTPAVQPVDFLPAALCFSAVVVLWVKRDWLRRCVKWAYWTIAWFSILAAGPVTAFVVIGILNNL